MNGKEKCKLLKKIRKAIAEENGISYEIKECNVRGHCKGYCPKCDKEILDLAKALEEKKSQGEEKKIPKLFQRKLTVKRITSTAFRRDLLARLNEKLNETEELYRELSKKISTQMYYARSVSDFNSKEYMEVNQKCEVLRKRIKRFEYQIEKQSSLQITDEMKEKIKSLEERLSKIGDRQFYVKKRMREVLEELDKLQELSQPNSEEQARIQTLDEERKNLNFEYNVLCRSYTINSYNLSDLRERAKGRIYDRTLGMLVDVELEKEIRDKMFHETYDKMIEEARKISGFWNNKKSNSYFLNESTKVEKEDDI